MRTRHTPEQRAEAIELAVTVGRAEASRRTGISPGTIGSWLTREGLSNADPEGRAQRIEVAQQTWVERRADLGNRMGEVATESLEALAGHVAAGQTSKARELATTLAVLVDKAQLLAGAATSRTEVTGAHGAPTQHPSALEQARDRARGLRAV